MEKAIAVAQEQYTSLLTGLKAVGQVKRWKVQQIVFVGGRADLFMLNHSTRTYEGLGGA
jgi:hypothetical protein